MFVVFLDYSSVGGMGGQYLKRAAPGRGADEGLWSVHDVAATRFEARDEAECALAEYRGLRSNRSRSLPRAKVVEVQT